MATVERRIPAPVEDVFAAVADPLTYPDWLVGTKEIRSIEPGWPAPGTKFHHRVGLVGPVTVNDSTTALSVEHNRCLELAVRARPFVKATVRFEVEPDSKGTRLTMHEAPVGLLRFARPVFDAMTHARNVKSLEQLEEFLTRRRSGVGTSTR